MTLGRRSVDVTSWALVEFLKELFPELGGHLYMVQGQPGGLEQVSF